MSSPLLYFSDQIILISLLSWRMFSLFTWFFTTHWPGSHFLRQFIYFNKFTNKLLLGYLGIRWSSSTNKIFSWICKYIYWRRQSQWLMLLLICRSYDVDVSIYCHRQVSIVISITLYCTNSYYTFFYFCWLLLFVGIPFIEDSIIWTEYQNKVWVYTWSIIPVLQVVVCNWKFMLY